MATPAKAPRSVTIRTSRETIALALAACAVTFALAYVVHSRSDAAKTGVEPVAQASSPIRATPAKGAASQGAPAQGAPAQGAPAQGAPAQDWTGHLADVGPSAAVAPGEPMTSASLVVSPSQLPPVTGPARPTAKKVCEGASCTARTSASSAAPTPPWRPTQNSPGPTPVVVRAAAPERGWPTIINPLNHLPDAASLKQPFTYVGDKVAGWFK